MEAFERWCPAPPGWELDWNGIRTAFDWVRAMENVPQDDIHHAEGDVATHTRMACLALADSSDWRRLPADRRVLLFATVLLHDVGKPYCTREQDGRITAHGHSRRGDLMARRILWQAGASVAQREHVAVLIRHHQVPFWALERPDLDRIVFRVSLIARNDDLAMLARADIDGRSCQDGPQVHSNIDLFAQYCVEQDCWDRPRAFPSDHARFQYFRTPGRDPAYDAFDDTRGTVTILSGLPGVGKDHWTAAQRPGQPVISLDGIRRELKVPPTGNQGPVIAAARERAREFLRRGEGFVWNATNVSRQLREQSINLAAAYRARVEIVALEAPEPVVRQRNRARTEPVPETVIDRLIRRWEAPDPTEAHTVDFITTT